MRYLLTNDDGIYARGLSALYKELSKEADCLIVAPEVERSAVGHAITLNRPLMVRRTNKDGNFLGYAVSGTPADCVKIGIRELSEKPVDLVVSGINIGANVGINVIYSGTVSAATEGAILGVPSMALSLGTLRNADYTVAADFARTMTRFMMKYFAGKSVALNINVPPLPRSEIKGIAVTRQGKARLIECFDKRVDPRERLYYWLAGETQLSEQEEPDSDGSALSRGMISITPIYHDMTRYDAIDGLKALLSQEDRLFPAMKCECFE